MNRLPDWQEEAIALRREILGISERDAYEAEQQAAEDQAEREAEPSSLTEAVADTLKMAPHLAPVVEALLDGLAEERERRWPVRKIDGSALDEAAEERSARRLRALDSHLRLVRGGKA